jgi:hypothetical protein
VRALLPALLVPVLLVLPAPAQALQLRFPTGSSHHVFFYPTAYRDHGGVTDWACGSNSYSGHRGSDFGVGSWSGMDAGREVRAAGDAVVTATHDGEFDRCTTADCPGGGGCGNHVELLHPDGRSTLYCHFKQWSVAVAVGQALRCGDLLGQVGSSGYSTGPHLHFEPRDSAESSFEPFAGSCGASSSAWMEQGDYGGLPGLSCDSAPTCPAAGRLQCGDVLRLRNDGAGSTGSHGAWGCATYRYSGPELSLELATDRDEPITLRLSGLSADLDLFVSGDLACAPADCLAASTEGSTSDEALSFSASAGRVYAVSVDGYDGAVSDFTLSVDCAGAWPSDGSEDSADPGTDSASPDGADGASEDDGPGTDPGEGLGSGGPFGANGADQPPGERVALSELGCQVAPSGRSLVWLGLGLPALLLRRRSARG